MKAKEKFNQFIIKAQNKIKENDVYTFHNVFMAQDVSEKMSILQSLVDMDEIDFLVNLNIVIKILPAFNNEKSEQMRPLLNQIIKNVIKIEPRKINKLSSKLLKEFSVPISEALEENNLVRADVVEKLIEASEENLEDFTEVIKKIMQRSDIINLALIVAMIPDAQLTNYYETIKSLMLNRTGICKTIMPLIPEDQVHNFYETLKVVIKDNSYKAQELIAIIPGDKMHEFREVITEVMKKNIDKIHVIIDAVNKKNDLSYYVDEIGRAMRQNIEYTPAIITAIVKSDKIEEFERSIFRVMIENPSKLDGVIKVIPNDKLERFYNAIYNVIKDDNEFNYGRNIKKILNSIPEENRVEFIAKSGNLLELIKNSDKKISSKSNKNQINGIILAPEPNHNILQQPVSKGNIKIRH